MADQRVRVTRGYIANYLGISKNALRNYEDKGLIRPRVGKNGYRYYRDPDVSTLSAIRMYREAGLSLLEIQAMMDCETVEAGEAALAAHLAALEEARAALMAKEAITRRLLDKLERSKAVVHIEQIDDGPVIYWRSRMTSPGGDSAEDAAWLAAMPFSAISGRLRFEGEALLEAECGMAITEADLAAHPVPLDGFVHRVDLRRSLRMIAPCTMNGVTYVREDYLPLLRHARDNGIRCGSTIYCYGLSARRLRHEAVYTLELYLPLL